MRKRKGWHRKKRRLRHDYAQQLGNELWNCMKRIREEAREHTRQFEAWMVKALEDSCASVAIPVDKLFGDPKTAGLSSAAAAREYVELAESKRK